MTGIEVCFTGRLGRDPELMQIKGGELPLLTFSCVVDQQHQIEDQPATGSRSRRSEPSPSRGRSAWSSVVRVYVENRLTVDLWQPDDGRAPRINIQVVATAVQPIGQIGRQRPRATRNAERDQRTWDRSHDASRAGAAGEALLRDRDLSRRRDNQEPAADWLDDSREAIRDLVEGPGR
jgi:single-stranded DNA-binding protein